MSYSKRDPVRQSSTCLKDTLLEEKKKKSLLALGSRKPFPQEEVPDLYVNAVKMLFSQFELLLQFGLKTNPNEEAKPVVNIRISPEHAKVLTAMLRKHIKIYETNVGEIGLLPQLIKDLGIQKEI